MRIDLGRKSKAAVDVKYLYRRTVNVVDVSYLISFAEGKHRDKERQNFRFLRGRNSSLDRRSACFLMKGPPAKAQSFATVLLWLQEPLLYRLAEAIIGACKKGKEELQERDTEEYAGITHWRTVIMSAGNYIHPVQPYTWTGCIQYLS